MKKMNKKMGGFGKGLVVASALFLAVTICCAYRFEDLSIGLLRVANIWGAPGESDTVTVRTDLAVSGTVSAVTFEANNIVSTNLTTTTTGVSGAFEVGGAFIVGTTSTLTGLVTIVGNVQANGDIYGDDATVVSNIASVYADSLLPDDGTTLAIGVAGDIAAVGGALTVAQNLSANGNIYGDGSTVVSNMASYYVGSTLGISAVVTNISASSTNVLTYTGGLLTGATLNP